MVIESALRFDAKKWKRHIRPYTGPREMWPHSARIKQHNHSQIAEILLKYRSRFRKEQAVLGIDIPEEITVVGKRHIQPRHVEDFNHIVSSEALSYDPRILSFRESSNMAMVGQILGQGFAPEMLHAVPNQKLFYMSKVEGPSYLERIVNAAPKGRLGVISDLVRVVARFVGTATAHKKEFLDEYDFAEDRDLREGRRFNTLGRRIQRIATAVQIKSESRLRTLHELWPKFGLKEVMAHGEANSAHYFRSTGGTIAIDWESLGLYDQPRDLCDALIIGAIGPNQLLDGRNFADLVFKYLAYEHAYGLSDLRETEEVLIQIETLDEFNLPRYLQRETGLDQEAYGNFMLGLYAMAIEKGIQLANTSSADRFDIEYTLERLFDRVANSQEHFYDSTNPKELREYFSILGELLTESGYIKIGGPTLDKIAKGESPSVEGVMSGRDALVTWSYINNPISKD